MEFEPEDKSLLMWLVVFILFMMALAIVFTSCKSKKPLPPRQQWVLDYKSDTIVVDSNYYRTHQ